MSLHDDDINSNKYIETTSYLGGEVIVCFALHVNFLQRFWFNRFEMCATFVLVYKFCAHIYTYVVMCMDVLHMCIVMCMDIYIVVRGVCVRRHVIYMWRER